MTTSPILAARAVIVLDDRPRDLLAFAITRADNVGGYPEIVVLGHFFEACSIAGALCAAFAQGKVWQFDEDVRPRSNTRNQRRRHNGEWFPGCGRRAL